MLKKTEVHNVDAQDLIEQITKEVQRLFLQNELESKKEEPILLTRKEAAKFLKINLSTLHNYSKQGKVNPLGLGNRVYFIKDELLKSLTYLNN